jgi:predicted small lipoprotein YifL
MVHRLSEPSMILASPAGRSILIAGLLVLGLAACGRRGALEPPPDPVAIAAERQKAAQRQALRASQNRGSVPSGQSAPALEGQANVPGQAQVADGGDADDPEAEGPAAASPTAALGATRKRVRQPFVIPKEPFILDPLL